MIHLKFKNLSCIDMNKDYACKRRRIVETDIIQCLHKIRFFLHFKLFLITGNDLMCFVMIS